MRAGIYLRISRDTAGQGLGVQRQREDCEELAKALGWEVADAYIDNDVSASSGKTRPDYQRMLRDIEAGDIGAIVAWHPDRLYRVLPDLLPLIDIIKKANAQIATCQAGHIDLSTPTGRMVASILASVATQEVEHKSERWSRSWQQGRERGAPVTNSNRLYGYERDGRTIVEHEAEIAREMVDRLLAGASHGSVLRWLQEIGATTTKGLTWRNAGLKVYLRNPRIAGWSTHKNEIVAEGDWPAIVDREKWEEVRALLGSRTRDYVPRKSLLNGLIFCGPCGTRLITGNGNGRRTYRCPARPGFNGCGRMSIYAEPAEELVEAYARARLDSPEVRAHIGELQAHPTGAQNELASLDSRIIELEQQLDEPGVPVAAILRAIERAKARQEEVLGQLAATRRVDLPRQGGPWPNDLRRRRELVELAVARIDLVEAKRLQRGVNPERVQITPR